MSRTLVGAALAALLLSSCGAKTLALPDSPIDRAATCGVVAAATARVAVTDIKAPLPLDAQGKIIHYAMLEASQQDEFSTETANHVSRRMSELQDRITKGKWRDLDPACRAAYPLAEKTEVTLPTARFEAQLECNELSQFLVTALEGQQADYGRELSDYRLLRRKLNDAIAPGLRSRAGSGLPAQQKARRKALAASGGRGSPTAMMRVCLKQFG